MDSALMDPELASEMVKLLAQELKVVRAQLREAERGVSSSSTGEPSSRLARERIDALVTENETLRTDNAAQRARLSRLEDELRQVSSIKSEDSIPNALQYEESMSRMREELAELLAEREDMVREKADASKCKEKHSVLREKYKRVKAEAHQYSEELNELRVELSNCTQDLEQVKKQVVTEIDFRAFLQDATHEVEGQLELASLRPYSLSINTKFHKSLAGMCKGPYFINTHEVIWSPGGIAFALIIKPTFQYNPKISKGTWVKIEDGFHIGKQMDVCLLTGKAWRYLGTYERMEGQCAMVIAPDTLQHLPHEKIEYASKRTTLFPDLVPPSQTQMIMNMYLKGVIKFQCFPIKLVAFNEALSEGLRNLCGQMPSSQSGSIIPTPSATSKQGSKRKCDAESAHHTTPSKKKKH